MTSPGSEDMTAVREELGPLLVRSSVWPPDLLLASSVNSTHRKCMVDV